jgi:hypothetical protein
MYSAEGDLTEMETERIKQEMEDHFEDPLEEGEGELTAEEMRMMMGEDKDDTKKILHVSTVLSAAALWSLHCPALPCTALHCPALRCTAPHRIRPSYPQQYEVTVRSTLLCSDLVWCGLVWFGV